MLVVCWVTYKTLSNKYDLIHPGIMHHNNLKSISHLVIWSVSESISQSNGSKLKQKNIQGIILKGFFKISSIYNALEPHEYNGQGIKVFLHLDNFCTDLRNGYVSELPQDDQTHLQGATQAHYCRDRAPVTMATKAQ